MKLHKEALNASYENRYFLKRTFSDVLGIHGINHCSINILSPNDEIMFFSSTPGHAFEICSRNLHHNDPIINPCNFKNKKRYSWYDANSENTLKELELAEIRERVFNFHGGFVLVRNLSGFIIMYSYAFSENSNELEERSYENENVFYAIGDWVCDKIKNLYQQYNNIDTPLKRDMNSNILFMKP